VLNTGRALTGLGAVCYEAAAMAPRASTAEVIAAIEEATPQIDTYYAPPSSEYSSATPYLDLRDAGRSLRGCCR